MKIRAAGIFCSVFLTTALGANPLVPGDPVDIRILYDNSGSMYPGYTPPGAADRHTREELGARFFHQSPQFVEWLQAFVQRQTILDGTTVGMWTFTSNGQFTANDIHEVHPVVPIQGFDAATAVRHFPAETGNSTYLSETVDAFTRDFTGVVWLITDNIVETNDGTPSAGVQNFFTALASRDALRSVHLFKYSFRDGDATAAIAVYGFLVSSADVPSTTLAYYDAKFGILRDAKRLSENPPTDLFPGHEYLKLKNLRITPVRAELQLTLSDGQEGVFKEGQTVELDVDGQVISLLTQHTVTGGRYELTIVSPFRPERWAEQDIGAKPLSPDRFDVFAGDLLEEIPPGGSRAIKAVLHSRQPVSFSPAGVRSWLQMAWFGATVRYTGTAQMSFNDVTVRLDSQRLAGIFGIDHATSAFDFQNVTTLPAITPSVVPVSFALRTGPARSAVLLVMLAILAAVFGALVWVLSRKRAFRIHVSLEPEILVALRPLGHHNVVHDGRIVGGLSRGLLGSYAFEPATLADYVVAATKDPNVWDIKLRNGPARRMVIKAEGGGSATPAGSRSALESRAEPPAPPPLPKGGPPPLPGRAPRIGKL